ncbi:putative Double Clp-N motif-containing P-loop nucleoside triphosphate hydrolases superfamily protein [Hibiscus syriacus]|uniref:Double Clp-N motif-containing P-loop nucleoside triphosphate hydrolases superfamily protein n=1 Tax=Hibiscus syriacus TaxID=106335 RepID=A0A6A3ALY3_HIBSY|nr:putative Double Clp-N motif-containing P-loop nucleoside triphosphate hydrolases superfamily protein [Hibiscus syriacus]
MKGESQKVRRAPQKFSLLLELSTSNDLVGFKRAIEEKGRDTDELNLWYGRRIGSRKMDYQEKTPLLIASMFGSKDVVKYIVKSGRVDVNQAHSSDGAALHCAAFGGSFYSTEVGRILLDASTDIESLDANGNRPVDLIAPSRNSAFLLKKKMLESLLRECDRVGEIEGLPAEIEGCNSVTRILKDGTQKKEYVIDLTLQDIKSEIYGTDEFRMYNFKVTPCSRAYSLDWTECPCVHPGENARRCDPRKYLYSSAVPSPRSSRHGLGSASVLLPQTSTPPLSPIRTSSSIVGMMWPSQSNVVLSLQLHGSRLKSARRAWHMDLDMEQHGLESRRRRQTQQLIDAIPGISSTTNWKNVMSTTSIFSAPADGTSELNMFGGTSLDTSTHQLQPTAATALSPKTNAFTDRSLSFMEHTMVNHHSRFSSPSALPSSLLDWVSSDGKLDGSVRGEELNKLKKIPSFAFKSSGSNMGDQALSMSSTSEEPDVSWVQSLVKNTPSEQLSFEDEQQQQQSRLSTAIRQRSRPEWKNIIWNRNDLEKKTLRDEISEFLNLKSFRFADGKHIWIRLIRYYISAVAHITIFFKGRHKNFYEGNEDAGNADLGAAYHEEECTCLGSTEVNEEDLPSQNTKTGLGSIEGNEADLGSICLTYLGGENSKKDIAYLLYDYVNALRTADPEGLDGCYLKGAFQGELMSVVRRYNNNQIFSIALNLGDGEKVTLLSDMQKGLLEEVPLYLQNVEHRLCARHIYANWKKKPQSR